MVGRDEALVAPPHVPGAPGEVESGEPLVGGARGGAAGERDPEGTRLPRPLRDPVGSQLG
jgi:hypothetical protein